MRVLRELTGWVCGLVLANAVLAAPADEIKALVEKGNAAAAYELAKKHPDQLGNPAFDFYFGVAAIDSGRAGEGVLALERYVVNFPGNVQARLELARGYFVLGEYTRAREEFNEVLKTNPPPAVVANIERFFDAIRARESAYRTTAGAFVEFGLGYDSNINGGVGDANIILPNFGLVTITPGGVKIGSRFAQLTGGANIVHPVAPGFAVFGSVSGDLKTHDVHGEFDQGNFGVAGGASYLKDKNLFRGTLSFSQLDVDYNRFRNLAGLAGEWIHQLDELQAVSASLQYAELDYAGNNSVRDARLYGISAGYRRAFIGPWQPQLTVSGAYSQENNRRSRDDLGRDIWGVRAAVGITPAPKWAVSAGATAQYSDYQAEDPLFSTTRRDRYYALDASVSYALTRNLSVRGELLLSKNQSNLALYEYKREVAAVKLRYDFK
jgi:tetratricopeptide (TPR) repeat protein